jgi:hypothetical protein
MGSTGTFTGRAAVFLPLADARRPPRPTPADPRGRRPRMPRHAPGRTSDVPRSLATLRHRAPELVSRVRPPAPAETTRRTAIARPCDGWRCDPGTGAGRSIRHHERGSAADRTTRCHCPPSASVPPPPESSASRPGRVDPHGQRRRRLAVLDLLAPCFDWPARAGRVAGRHRSAVAPRLGGRLAAELAANEPDRVRARQLRLATVAVARDPRPYERARLRGRATVAVAGAPGPRRRPTTEPRHRRR